MYEVKSLEWKKFYYEELDETCYFSNSILDYEIWKQGDKWVAGYRSKLDGFVVLGAEKKILDYCKLMCDMNNLKTVKKYLREV